MAKSKTFDDKARHRKPKNLDGLAKDTMLSPTNKSSVQTSSEKSRVRKSHRKGHAGLFSDFGSELCNRLVMGVFAFILVALMLHFGVLYSQNVRRLRQVNTPINFPNMIGPNETGPDSSPELFWGTYRPNVFFGMSHRSPHSMLFGLAWVAFDGLSLQFRHQCTNDGDLKGFNWIEHDGRNYGIQTIISGNHNITVAFVKRSDTPNGGDWSTRISLSAVNESLATRPISIIVYAYLPDSTRGQIQAYTNGAELKRLRGFTKELGAFQVNFHIAKKGTLKPTHLVGHCPREDALVAAISSGLALRDKRSVFLTGNQAGLNEQGGSTTQMPLNLWVMEVTCPGSPANRRSVTPANGRHSDDGNRFPLDVLEIEFVSQASTSSDAVPLIGSRFDEALAYHSKKFHDAFRLKFPHNSNTVSEEQLALSKISLSNLLGGMGYFYGTSLISSPLLQTSVSSKSQSPSVPTMEYWPTSLFTATPSRTKFPRGFLWDEGFHIIMIARWDLQLALQSLGHWLDLLNAEGWIPREQVLGWEARANVPPEFIVQSTAVANPPALILAIEDIMDRLDTHLSAEEARMFKRWARAAFPRLLAWFTWFNATQAGELPTAFRWRGRPENNPFQLNPLTLASGLDDYPRASHPTISERHLDLRCWMATFARTLIRLAKHFEDLSPSTDTGSAISSSVEEYRAMAEQLLDPQQLDELHWDEASGIYADFGLHSESVALVKRTVQGTSQSDEPKTELVRRVLIAPQEQLVTSSVGYVSFFPLFLRLLPPTSPRLPTLLQRLADPDLLSPYGLRSLATTSPFYSRANTEHDPPYWRGAVWMNINYLAVEAVRFYAQHPKTPVSVSEMATNLYKRLRAAMLNTVLGELNRTGHTWENYDDRKGRGLGGHPFNGWTALFSLIMTEETTHTGEKK